MDINSKSTQKLVQAVLPVTHVQGDAEGSVEEERYLLYGIIRAKGRSEVWQRDQTSFIVPIISIWPHIDTLDTLFFDQHMF